ncbi:MAG: radical SAM protein [Candidatus Omnitrophota bacterium]
MRYKHALFINPYIESSVNSTMKLFPPIGLEYVATSALGLADKVTMLDLRHEDELSQTDRLLEFINKGVDIICVSIGWDRQYKEICELLNKMPDNIPLVVGGYKATEKVEELFTLCPTIDIIVRGEGEESIRDIMKDMTLDDIPGISFRKNGKIIHNKNRPLPDIDSLATPDRSLRRSKYSLTLNGIDATGLSFDSVLSARGCPYNCKFCTFSLNPLGQKRNYSPRNVKSVVDEIEKTTAKAILFSDDNLFADPKRAEVLCDMIIERKIKKKFIAQARLEIAKYPTLLKKMVKAGFKALLIGIESPHDRILKQLNKGFDSATVRKAFAVLRKYPLYCHGYFIFGNITETEEEMLYIPKFAKEIGVDSITFNKLRIEKFSPLRQLAESTPGYHITEKGELYSDEFSHARLKKIGRRMKFDFYTPARFLKMMYKCIFVIRFFTFKETALLFVNMPRVLKSVIDRELSKVKLADSLKRSFISNK